MPTFRVDPPGPLDVPLSLGPMGRWGDDMLDRWDGTTLVRTVEGIPYAAVSVGTRSDPALDVTVEDEAHIPLVRSAVERTFLQAPPSFPDLAAQDPVVAGLEARYPGLRPILYGDLFAALVRSISAQQVNLAWAATTRRRLAEAFGRGHEVAGRTVYSLDGATIAGLDPQQIRALQFTSRKAEYIVGLAGEVASERLRVTDLAALPDEEVIATLTALRGIGVWTAEWILTRTLGRPRVVAGDLGVRKAVGAAYGLGPRPVEEEVRQATAHWGASGAVAQTLLLHGFAEGDV